MNFTWLFKTPIAHRGLHDEKFPENSMGAFENAINNGFNIEIDVHLTSDNHLVVFHDDTLKRVCGIDRKIKTMTLNEVRSAKLLNSQYTIPTFDKFLSMVNGRTGILCEIKGVLPWDLAVAKAVCERLKTFKGKIAIQSFNFGAVSYCRKHSNVPCGQLCSWHGPKPELNRSHLAALYGKLWVLKISKPHFIAYDIRSCANNYPENKYLVKAIKERPVLFWTVNNAEKVDISKKYANNIIFEKLPIELVKSTVGKCQPLCK